MKLCILGMGYIGLPTAVMFAKHGIRVHGVDINPGVINKLISKKTHIFEPDLELALIDGMNQGNLTVSNQPEEADAFIIAVQTPITSAKKANLDYVSAAAETILPYVRKGNLVLLESTVPPGTVEHTLIPILQKSGLNIGEELFIAYSPERVLPGKLLEELAANDRIIGGINQVSSEIAANLYRIFVKGRIHLTNTVTAEMVKLMENAYRDLNIAFANELAGIAEKIGFNVWDAIDLANTHPRVQIHKPGSGVGGHCIPVDPWFIAEKAPEDSRLISLSRNINDTTPYRIAALIEDMVKEIPSPVISLLGLAYKRNADDLRESPSLTILHELRRKGYELKVYDPFVNQDIPGKVSSLEEAAAGSDCLVILTDHDAFKNIDFNGIKHLLRTGRVIDTRGIMNKSLLEKSGISCTIIGTANKKMKEQQI